MADLWGVPVYIAEIRSREHVLRFSSQYRTVPSQRPVYKIKVRSEDLTAVTLKYLPSRFTSSEVENLGEKLV